MFEIRVADQRIPAYRIVKGFTKSEAEAKATVLKTLWEERWQKRKAADENRARKIQRENLLRTGKFQAQELTTEIQSTIMGLESLLKTGIGERIMDWEDLKDRKAFTTPAPKKPASVDMPARPSENSFAPALSVFDKLFTGRKIRKIEKAAFNHAIALSIWDREVQGLKSLIEEESEEHKKAVQTWKQLKSMMKANQDAQHASVEESRAAYSRTSKAATEYLLNEALSRSEYPDGLSQGFEVSFDPDSKIVVLDFELPNLNYLPKYKEAKFVAARGELQYVPVTDTWKKSIYDSMLYQCTLRSISRIFRVDRSCIVLSVVFNGWVRSIDKATGAEVHACILSVQAGRDEFMCLDLNRVDPKSCFRSLKGISSSTLIELTPIRPILRLNKEDSRFIKPYAVAELLDERVNLAAMDWQDFENLIREIFEKEFSRGGGEVKITRASRDGGVDAVAFDPDPLRGGKMVIQAKRYTNTVGVSAVRDLFGTVQHEGAMKGILVTTATFGPDAYEFARDKPLTLLNGAELLGMLERHGHKAKINLVEARAQRDLAG